MTWHIYIFIVHFFTICDLIKVWHNKSMIFLCVFVFFFCVCVFVFFLCVFLLDIISGGTYKVFFFHLWVSKKYFDLWDAAAIAVILVPSPCPYPQYIVRKPVISSVTYCIFQEGNIRWKVWHNKNVTSGPFFFFF